MKRNPEEKDEKKEEVLTEVTNDAGEQITEQQITEQKETSSEKEEKKKTWIRRICNIVMIAGILFIAFCFFKIWNAHHQEQQGVQVYESLRKTTEKEEPVKEEKEPEKIYDVNFDELKAINPDTVGWIRFDEPSEINYPIVKGQDNDKYLKYIFDGTYNTTGTIFMDVVNNAEFTDHNTFIYGHNMQNDSMFAKLHEYIKHDFYNSYPYFYIYTPDGMEHTYQIFAVCEVLDGTDSYTKQFDSDEAFMDYVNMVRGISLYQTDVEVGPQSKIVSLSTCMDGYSDERLIVHGVETKVQPNLKE